MLVKYVGLNIKSLVKNHLGIFLLIFTHASRTELKISVFSLVANG